MDVGAGEESTARAFTIRVENCSRIRTDVEQTLDAPSRVSFWMVVRPVSARGAPGRDARSSGVGRP
jgi:hypothetical protein